MILRRKRKIIMPIPGRNNTRRKRSIMILRSMMTPRKKLLMIPTRERKI